MEYEDWQIDFRSLFTDSDPVYHVMYLTAFIIFNWYSNILKMSLNKPLNIAPDELRIASSSLQHTQSCE